MAPLNPETDVSMFKFGSFCKYFISKVFGEISKSVNNISTSEATV